MRIACIPIVAVVVLLAVFQAAGDAQQEAQPSASQANATAAAPVEFEVASVRPTGIEVRNLGVDEFMFRQARRAWRGQVSLRTIPLAGLLQLAHDVRGFQIQGGPDWVNTTNYTIEAVIRAETGLVTLERVRPALRKLLAERFKLTLHREMRPLPVLELRPVEGRSNRGTLKETECKVRDPQVPLPPPSLGAPLPPFCGMFRQTVLSPQPGMRFEAQGVPIDLLVEWLSAELGRIVLDGTGLAGRYDYRLDFEPGQSVGLLPNTGARDSQNPEIRFTAPALLDAVKGQLGLELVQTRRPVEVIVIDHVERPSENQ